MRGMDEVHKGLFFEFDSGGKRGDSSKLLKKCSRLNIRKYTFSNQVLDKWKNLYCKIVLLALR